MPLYADFRASPLRAVRTSPVQFDDLSTVDGGDVITSRTWHSGDGQVSNDFIYNNHGQYSPSLDISNVGATWLIKATPAGIYSAYILAHSTSLGVTVALSYNGAIASADGNVWVDCALPAAIARWQGVTFGAGKFVMPSVDDGEICTSLDGFLWTKQVGAGYYGLYDITYANGYFFGTCTWSSGGGLPPAYSGAVAYSIDAVTWVIGYDPNNPNCYSRYANGNYILLDNLHNLLHYTDSVVSLAWNTYDFSGFSVTFSDIAFGNNIYVSVYSDLGGDERIGVSPDLTNWTEYTIAGTNSILRITFASGLFYATTNLGIYSSPDGQVWTLVTNTTNTRGIISTADQIVAGRNTNNAAIVISEADQSDTITKENYIIVDDLDVTIEPKRGKSPLTVNFGASEAGS